MYESNQTQLYRLKQSHVPRKIQPHCALWIPPCSHSRTQRYLQSIPTTMSYTYAGGIFNKVRSTGPLRYPFREDPIIDRDFRLPHQIAERRIICDKKILLHRKHIILHSGGAYENILKSLQDIQKILLKLEFPKNKST